MKNAEEFFELEGHEAYEKRCGEIYVTSKGRLAFHCDMCDIKYKGFEAYLAHLLEQHFITSSEFLEDDFGMEPRNLEYIMEGPNENITEISNESELMEGPYTQNHELLTEVSMERDDIDVTKKTEAKASSLSPNNLEKFYVRNVRRRRQLSSIPNEKRKHKCPICSLAFVDKNNMLHHLRRHSNNKKYKCPVCDKMFFTRTEMRIHARCHTDARPYLCSVCGKSYRTAANLTEHTRKHADQQDQAKCPICEKVFSKRYLEIHMTTHSSERPFSCDLCDCAFARRLTLSNHRKLHENKREYICNICGMGFNQKAGLFSHKKTTHKIL